MYRCCAKHKLDLLNYYETSTGVGHAFIPPTTQHHEYLRRNLRQEILDRNFEVLGDTYITTNNDYHDWKIGEKDLAKRAMNNKNMNFMRTVKEKNLMKPPEPVGVGACGVTECQRNYTHKILPQQIEKYSAVEPTYICKCRGLGRDEQPPIPTEAAGIFKQLDPYVSVTQMTHVPFTREQQLGVAKKDIDTFYDIIRLPKVKGFGPKITNFIGPMLSVRREPVYDALVCKEAKIRVLPKLASPVPYVGMKTEHQAKYTMPVDDLSSKRWDSGVEYNQPFPRPSPWVTLSAPNMYCTEYCHIGSKKFPVRIAVDPYKNTKTVKNTMCCIWHPASCQH